jgi:hypothetical protein
MFAPEVTDADQVSRVHVIAAFLNGGMIAVWVTVAVDQ